MRMTTLPSGEKIPVLGQGTWHMGEDPDKRSYEITALLLGIRYGTDGRTCPDLEHELPLTASRCI
jgi:hypothetical protein